MPKRAEDMHARLQWAALELFSARGYDQVTAAEIAAHAGVTERTFFRYFPDKREVLFEGEAAMQATLVAAVASAPVELGPLDTLFRAFKVLAPEFERNRSLLESRFKVVFATPALREREGTKRAVLADALSVALQARGADHLSADLAAQAALVGLTHATSAWLDDPSTGHAERITVAAQALKAMFAGSA